MDSWPASCLGTLKDGSNECSRERTCCICLCLGSEARPFDYCHLLIKQGNNPFLLLKGGQRNFDAAKKFGRHSLLSGGSGKRALRGGKSRRLTDEVMNPLRKNFRFRTDDVKLRRSEANVVRKLPCDSVLPVLHAGRNLGEEDVASLKVRVASLQLCKAPELWLRDRSEPFIDSRHRNESRGGVRVPR